MPLTPVKGMVADAKTRIRTLSVAEVQAAMAEDSVLLVDIRDPRELDREGKIPGAFHAPRGMIEFWLDPESPYHKPALATDKTLVLYCQSAWRSALTVDALMRMGVDNIAEVGGGFRNWVDAGGATEPVEKKD